MSLNPLDLVMAQAIALRAQADALRSAIDALVVTVDALEVRHQADAPGAPSAPFLMGAPAPTSPATALATPTAIPTQAEAHQALNRHPTFDGPVRAAPVTIPVPALTVAPDAFGDIRPAQ